MAVTVDNIIQRILLDGDRAIVASLNHMATAGEKAFAGIAAAAISTNRAIDVVHRTMGRLAPQAVAIGRSAGGAFLKGAEAIGNMASSATLLARRMLVLQAAVAGVTGGLGALVKGAAGAADKVTETADALGISTKRYQELSAGAIEAGVSEEQFGRALGFFNKQIEGSQKETRQFAQQQEDLATTFRRTTSDISARYGDATEAVNVFGETVDNVARDKAMTEAWQDYRRSVQDLTRDMGRSEDVFRRYGITIAKADDGSVDMAKTLDNVADVMQKLGPGFDRASVAQQLFGTRNQRMVNLLSDGSEGLQQYAARSRQLGTTVDELSLKMGSRLSDAFDRFNNVIDKNRIFILRPLMAPLADLMNGLSEAVARNRQAWQNFIQYIADQVQPVIEDLIALMEGREADVKSQWILDAKDAWNDFSKSVGQAVKFMVSMFKALLEVLDLVAKGINAVFGTDISGTTLALIAVFAKLTGTFGVIVAAFSIAGKAVMFFVSAVGLLTAALAALAFLLGYGLVKALMAIPWGKMWDYAKEVFWKIIDGVKWLWDAVVQGFSDGIDWVKEKFWALVEWLGEAWDTVVAAIESGWNAIKELAGDAMTAIQEQLGKLGEAIVEAWRPVFEWFGEKITWLIEAFAALIKKAREFIGLKDDTGGTEAAPAGLARGGPIYGPGTETSDSILARLSRGEFVMNAKAVRRYGLGMMHALNRMKLPRGLFSGFNAGGFIEPLRTPVPQTRFAQGGPVASGSRRIVNLTIDGHQFPGMMAPESVADNLVRFATIRAVRSAGRRPNWYGGKK